MSHALRAVVFSVLVACAVWFAVRAATPYAPGERKAELDVWRALFAAISAGGAAYVAYL